MTATLTSQLTDELPRRRVRVVFSNGRRLVTSARGSEDSIARYYLDNEFRFEESDELPANSAFGVAVEFLD